MRIEAGEFRGRALLGPAKEAVARPITGLARKSVFGTLQAWLEGAAVADLYCGTGTLGLEAISRGASHCWFAERERDTVERLKQNIQTLGVAERATVWAGDVPGRLAGWLEGLPRALDVAFVDPPFAQAREWQWRLMESSVFVPLAARLAPEGLVVLRTDGRTEVPERLGPLGVALTKTYGIMTVRFFAAEAP
jgi:16S rRNA (guanine(966)-N(2))-methyltransferase RsmD